MALDPVAATRMALSHQEPVGRRMAKLKALKQHASSITTGPSKPNAAPFWLGPSTQQLLPLLLMHNLPEMLRNAAVSTVATLGAQLAVLSAPQQHGMHVAQLQQRGGNTGIPADLLFECITDVLQGKQHTALPMTSAMQPSLYQNTLLATLTEAIKQLNPTATLLPAILTRSLAACITLLEATSTSPQQLPHILTCIQACISKDTEVSQSKPPAARIHVPGLLHRSTGSPAGKRAMNEVFTDLIDLLLGWSLDPSITQSDRHRIHTMFLNLKPFWSEHSTFAITIADSIASDLQDKSEAIAQKQTALATSSTSQPADMVTDAELTSCFRLAGSLSAVVRALSPHFASELLLLAPKTMAAFQRLLSYTTSQFTMLQTQLDAMANAPFAPSAHDRRAQAAAKAAAESQLALITEQHGSVVACFCQTITQLAPAFRDAIHEHSMHWPPPTPVLHVIQQPCCPILHDSTTVTATPDVSRADAAETDSSLVKRLVADVFSKVIAHQGEMVDADLVDIVAHQPVQSQSQLQADSANIKTALIISPHETAQPTNVTLWVMAGMLELLLQALSSPASRLGSMPTILTTCAMVLCIAAGVDESACVQLATDYRLLGLTSVMGAIDISAISNGHPSSQVYKQAAAERTHGIQCIVLTGVWGLRFEADEAVREALLALLCDLMTMAPSISNQLLAVMLSELELAYLPAAAKQDNRPAISPQGDAAATLDDNHYVAQQAKLETACLFNLELIKQITEGSIASHAQQERIVQQLSALLAKFATASPSNLDSQQTLTEDNTAPDSVKSIPITLLPRLFSTLSTCAEKLWWSKKNDNNQPPATTTASQETVQGTASTHVLEQLHNYLCLAKQLLVSFSKEQDLVGEVAASVSLLLDSLMQHVTSAVAVVYLCQPAVTRPLLDLLYELASMTQLDAQHAVLNMIELFIELLNTGLVELHDPTVQHKIECSLVAHFRHQPATPDAHETAPDETGHDSILSDSFGLQSTMLPLDLLLGLTTLGMQLLGHSDHTMAGKALPVVLALSAGPLAGLTTVGTPAACQQAADAKSAVRNALNVPAWHDELAQLPIQYMWRPSNLARLFVLLFPEATAAMTPDPAAQTQKARLPIAPTGLLLKRRPDPSTVSNAGVPETPPSSLQTTIQQQPISQTAESSKEATSGASIVTGMLDKGPWLELAVDLSPVEARDVDLPADNANPTGIVGGTGSTVIQKPKGRVARPGCEWHALSSTWLVIQDASRSIVSSRLRTHMGGPSQTFAALEKLLQGLYAQLTEAVSIQQRSPQQAGQPQEQTSNPQHKTVETLKETAWLALEFIEALERCVVSACHGPPNVHDPLPQPVLAFFATNKNVCEGWFTRNRDLVFRISVLAGSHHSTVFHGRQRLADLQASMKTLLSQQQQSSVMQGSSMQAAQPVASGNNRQAAPEPVAGKQVSKNMNAPKSIAQQPGGARKESATQPKKQTVNTQPPPTPPRVLLSKSGSGSGSGPSETPQTDAAAARSTSISQSFAKLARDVVHVLQGMSESYFALGDWGSLRGLRSFATTAFGVLWSFSSPSVMGIVPANATSSELPASQQSHEDPFLWLLGLSQMAQGRFEQALLYFSTFMRQQHARDTIATHAASQQLPPGLPLLTTLQPLVSQAMADCYAAVADWAHFHAFVSTQHKRAQTDKRTASWWAATMGSERMQDICALASFDANGPFNSESKTLPTSKIQAALLAGLRAVNSQQTVHARAKETAQHFQEALGSAMPSIGASIMQACWLGWNPGLLKPLTSAHLLSSIKYELEQQADQEKDNDMLATVPILHTLQSLQLLPCSAIPVHKQLPISSMQVQLHPESMTLACLSLPDSLLRQSDGHWSHHPELSLPTLQQLLRLHAMQDPTASNATTQQLLLATAHTARSLGNTDLCMRLLDRIEKLPAITAHPYLTAAVSAARSQLLADSGVLSPSKAVTAQLMVLQPLLMKPKQLMVLANDAAAAASGAKSLAASVTAAPFVPGKPVQPAIVTQATKAQQASSVFGCSLPTVAAPSLAAAFLSLSRMMGLCNSAQLASLTGASIGSHAHDTASSPVALVDWVGLLKMLATSPLPMTPGSGVHILHHGMKSAHQHQGDEAGSITILASQCYIMPTESSSSTMTGVQASTAHQTALREGRIVSVPRVLLRQHTQQACAHVAALHLDPSMPVAWLQWGTALLAWHKLAKQQQTQSRQAQEVPEGGIPPVRTSVAGEAATNDSSLRDDVQLAAAGVHALCMWLRCAWSKHEFGAAEDAMPVLLKILQVIARQGPVIEHHLSHSLSLPPARIWQALTPQLFAQLRHTQSAVRRLVLSLMQGMSSSELSVVVYPALAEARAAERGGGSMLPELKVLVQGLQASHPRLVADLHTLMTEAERLTVTWEEKWHSLLSELEVDVPRRCVTLRAEAERLETLITADTVTKRHSKAQLPRSTEAADVSPEQPDQSHSTQVPAAKVSTGKGGGGAAAKGVAEEEVTSVPMAAAQPPKAGRGRGRGRGRNQQPMIPDPKTAVPQQAVKGVAGLTPPAPGIQGKPTSMGAAVASPAKGKRSDKAGVKKKGKAMPVAEVLAPPVQDTAQSGKPLNAWAVPLPFLSGKLPDASSGPANKTAVPAGWGASGVRDILPDITATESATELQTGGIAAEANRDAELGSLGNASKQPEGDKDQPLTAEEHVKAAAEAAQQREAMLRNRYTALMSPVVLLLERNLRACAACQPETPAEQQFADQMLPKLTAAITAFKSPPADLQLSKQPQQCWWPLKEVLQALDEQLRKPTLQLAHVSPALAGLTDTEMPLPGLPAGLDADSTTASVASGIAFSGVRIAGVHPVLRVLPSKTRPKRLVLQGSDGEQYVYLLKGRDDLRMDERIMQVMRVCNSLLQGDRSSSQMGLAARHYSVTPLGERVGLIQWVENTTSMFSLFKSWQSASRERHAAMQAARLEAAQAASQTEAAPSQSSQQGRGAGPSKTATNLNPIAPVAAAQPPLPPLNPMAATSRPSDLFYSHLLPELKAAGITGMVPRKQWPQAVLLKVLSKLTHQAPSQIVAHQLQGSSGSFNSWWARHRSYAASMAVMSVMGYLLGIGDRHMDNILLDTAHGEVVHIDFNISFERGLQLRVPELVPFRLTPSLIAALGIAGNTEGGTFRTICEVVLGALRASRETLVSLMDGVLGDPSVAWSQGGEREAAARRDLELAVTLSLFVSRVEESKPSLSKQCEQLLSLLSGPGKALIAYLNTHMSLAAYQSLLTQSQKQIQEAQAAEAAAHAGHQPAVDALQAAVNEHKALQNEARELQEAATQIIQECRNWALQHNTVLSNVRDGAAPELSAPASIWSSRAADVQLGLISLDLSSSLPHTRMAAVQQSSGVLTAVLSNAISTGNFNQDLLAACLDADKQGSSLLQQWDSTVGGAVSALNTYGTVLRVLLPPGYADTSYHHLWGKAMSHAVAATSPLAMEQAKSMMPQLVDFKTTYTLWSALQAALDAAAKFDVNMALSKACHLTQETATDITPSQQAIKQKVVLNVASTKKQVLELLASYAVQDESDALKPLRSAFKQLICQAMSSLQSHSNTATGTSLADELELGESSSMPASLNELQVDQLMPGSTVKACLRLIDMVERTGLWHRMLGFRNGVNQQLVANLQRPARLKSSMLAGLAAWEQFSTTKELTIPLATADVTVLVQHGDTTVLQQAAGLLATADAQLQDITSRARALQDAMQQHQQLLATYKQQVEATVSGEITHVLSMTQDEGKGQQSQQLETLHQAWDARHQTQQQLQQQLYAMHEATANTMNQVYTGLIGAGAPLTAILQAIDNDLCQNDVHHATQDNSSSMLFSATCQQLFSISPEQLCNMVAADPQCQLKLAQTSAALLQKTVVPPRNEQWGALQPSHVISGPAALIFHASHLNCQLIKLLGDDINSDPKALPHIMSCWAPQMKALQTLHSVVQSWLDDATNISVERIDDGPLPVHTDHVSMADGTSTSEARSNSSAIQQLGRVSQSEPSPRASIEQTEVVGSSQPISVVSATSVESLAAVRSRRQSEGVQQAEHEENVSSDDGEQKKRTILDQVASRLQKGLAQLTSHAIDRTVKIVHALLQHISDDGSVQEIGTEQQESQHVEQNQLPIVVKEGGEALEVLAAHTSSAAPSKRHDAHSAQHQTLIDTSLPELPPLEAFTDFNPHIAGADMALEDGLEDQGGDISDASNVAPMEGDTGLLEDYDVGLAAEYLLPRNLIDEEHGSGETSGMHKLTAVQEKQHGYEGTSEESTAMSRLNPHAREFSIPGQDATPAPPPTLESTLQAFARHLQAHHQEQMLQSQQNAGSATPVMQDAIDAVQSYIRQKQTSRLHHLAALSWINEHVFAQGLGTDQPPTASTLHQFFADVVVDPLEPTARLHITNRHHIVRALQAFCDGLPAMCDSIKQWAHNTASLAQMAVQAVTGTGSDHQFIGGLLGNLLERRQQWLTSSQAYASNLAGLCAAVVQLEISRQGAAWAPGSPLVPDAFASCYTLITRVEHVYAALGEQYSKVIEGQEKCRQLSAQANNAVQIQRACRAQAEACEAHLSHHTPDLVLAEAQLAPALTAMMTTLPDAVTTLCKELGAMLKEFQSMISNQSSAKDVASLTTSAANTHNTICTALQQLTETLPQLQQARITVAGQHVLPSTVVKDIQDGKLPSSLDVLAMVSQRGAALLAIMQPFVDNLQPSLQTINEMTTHVTHLLDSLDSLAVAARSVATAIQSEHALENIDNEANQSADAADAELDSQEASGAASQLTPLSASPGNVEGSSPHVSQAATQTGGHTPTAQQNLSMEAVGLSPAAAPRVSSRKITTTQAGAARARQVWMEWHHVTPVNKQSSAQQQQQQQDAQRRAYAVAALKRCIQKLEGRDRWDVTSMVETRSVNHGTQPGEAGRSSDTDNSILTVAQQVDLLIKQATSPEHLCRMYEGWMPWL